MCLVPSAPADGLYGPICWEGRPTATPLLHLSSVTPSEEKRCSYRGASEIIPIKSMILVLFALISMGFPSHTTHYLWGTYTGRKELLDKTELNTAATKRPKKNPGDLSMEAIQARPRESPHFCRPVHSLYLPAGGLLWTQ